MSLSIEQLRAAFKKDEGQGNNGGNRPNNYYPFWNIKTGEQAVVRFLPDKNSANPLGFMVEKLMHTLTINGENKSVPCLKMYGEECPICKVSAAFYKEGDKANGKKYWRKKQNLVQALIVEDPLPADADTGETHEGKVRFLALGYQLFNVIKEAFEGGELDEVPFAYEGGCNFTIKKTKQGEYDTYALGSKFARRASDLTEDEIAYVEENITDLATLLPKNPGVEKVENMLEAALTGAEYQDSNSGSAGGNEEDDFDDDGRPIGAQKPTIPTSKPAAKPAPAARLNEDDDEDGDDEVSSSDGDADEEADRILAQIRARRNK